MAQRRARRPWGPPLAAVVVTGLLVAVLGSEQLIDRAGAADRSVRPLLGALTDLPAWATTRLPADLEWAVAAKMATLLLAVAVLSRVIAAAGSRMAAFLAGWAVLVLSAALAALVFLQVGDPVPATSHRPAPGLAAAFQAIDTGARFGLYTGWLVGLAIAAVMHPGPHPAATQPAPAPGSSPQPTGAGSAIRATKTTKAPKVPNAPTVAQPGLGPQEAEKATTTPEPVATWPPRPRIGTVLPNPAWTAAGLHQEPDRPKADAS